MVVDGRVACGRTLKKKYRKVANTWWFNWCGVLKSQFLLLPRTLILMHLTCCWWSVDYGSSNYCNKYTIMVYFFHKLKQTALQYSVMVELKMFQLSFSILTLNSYFKTFLLSFHPASNLYFFVFAILLCNMFSSIFFCLTFLLFIKTHAWTLHHFSI